VDMESWQPRHDKINGIAVHNCSFLLARETSFH